MSELEHNEEETYAETVDISIDVAAVQSMINDTIASLAGLHMNRLQGIGHDETVTAGALQSIWGEVLQERTHAGHGTSKANVDTRFPEDK